MAQAETTPGNKAAIAEKDANKSKVSELSAKLAKAMGINAADTTKAGIISEYAQMTFKPCATARITHNNTRDTMAACFGIPGSLIFTIGGFWIFINFIVNLIHKLNIIETNASLASWIWGGSLAFTGFMLVGIGITISILPTCTCCGRRKALPEMNLCNLCLRNDVSAITGERNAPEYALKAARTRLKNFINKRWKEIFLNEVHELSGGLLLPATWDTKGHQVFELSDARVVIPPEVEEKVEKLKTTRVAPHIVEMKAFLKPYRDPIAVKVSLLGLDGWFKLAEWPS